MCFVLFHDKYFFPAILGGEGQCSTIFDFYPNIPEIPYINQYYMMQFGVHLYTLLDHIFVRYKEPKFYELFLHHGTAVFLIFYSYLTNCLPVGVMVLFTHDPGDVMLDVNRVLNDWNPRYKKFIDFTYVSFVVSWLYLRLGTYPFCVVKATWDFSIYFPIDAMLKNIHLYLTLMLISLVGLHIYWFGFVWQILMNQLKSTGEVNIYDTKKRG